MAKKKSTPTVDTLTQVQRDFNSAIEYVRSSYWNDWEAYWKLYNNERIPQLVGYYGTASTFDPMTFSTVETILANVYGSKPKFQFIPTMEEQEKDTKILNALANYYWECNNMSSTVIQWGREVLITGNGALFIGWGKDKPVVNHVPIRDCFFDPTSRNLDDCRFAGYRRLTTLDELRKAKVYNADTDSWEPRYQNIDQIKTWTNGANDQTDKELKDCYDASTLDGEAKKEQVEVIYYVTRDKVVEMANRSVIISEEDTPFQRDARTVTYMKKDDEADEDDPGVPTKVTVDAIEPFLPVVLQRNYIDGSLLYAKGEVEPIAHLQELLNDTANQHVDNVSLNLDEVKLIDPQYADLIPEIQSAPGAIIAIPPNAMREMPKQDMTGTAQAEMARIKQSIRETTGADEVVKGVKQGGDITATEINAQMNQAGQRFAMKIQGLENEGYKQLATIWFKMVQIFATGKQVVKVVGEDGIEWLKYNPDMYWGEYEPMVQLESVAKAMDKEKQQNAIQLLTVLRGDPLVNQKELYKKTLTNAFGIDEDEAELLLANQSDQDPMAALMGGDPGQVVPGMPGMQAPQGAGAPPPPTSAAPSGQVHENADLVKLYLGTTDAGLQAQIVQALGFQPSDPSMQPPDPKVADMQVNAALKIQQAQHLQAMTADQQAHTQGLDRAKLTLEAHKHALAIEQAQQMAQQTQPVEARVNG